MIHVSNHSCSSFRPDYVRDLHDDDADDDDDEILHSTKKTAVGTLK